MSQEIKEELIDINTLSSRCGYFTSDTIINNGYGCNHPNCYDGVYTYNGKQINLSDAELIVAKGLTKRNIKCNRRLSKKFIKKARRLLFFRIYRLMRSEVSRSMLCVFLPTWAISLSRRFHKIWNRP